MIYWGGRGIWVIYLGIKKGYLSEFYNIKYYELVQMGKDKKNIS